MLSRLRKQPLKPRKRREPANGGNTLTLRVDFSRDVDVAATVLRMIAMKPKKVVLRGDCTGFGYVIQRVVQSGIPFDDFTTGTKSVDLDARLGVNCTEKEMAVLALIGELKGAMTSQIGRSLHPERTMTAAVAATAVRPAINRLRLLRFVTARPVGVAKVYELTLEGRLALDSWAASRRTLLLTSGAPAQE